jgi:hypothetical protein
VVNDSAPTPDAVPTVCPGEDMRECGPAGTQREREEMARAVLSVVMDSHYAGAVTDKLIALGYRKPAAPVPIPTMLRCPKCALTHVDEGEWATKPHRAHLCAWCGHEWRPYDYPTVGVLFPPAAPDAPCGHAYWAAGCAQCAFHLGKALTIGAAPDAPTPGSINGISMAEINLLREIAQRGIEKGLRCNYRPTPRTLLALANVAARAFAPESRKSEASQVQDVDLRHVEQRLHEIPCESCNAVRAALRSFSVQPEGTDDGKISGERIVEDWLRQCGFGNCIAQYEREELVRCLRALDPEGDGKRGSSVRDDGSRPAASSELRSGEAT